MRRFSATAVLCALVLTCLGGPGVAQVSGEHFPTRVLLTNDNGIEDPKLLALARAFATRAETWVIAPEKDRSGAGAALTITRTGGLTVESRDLGPGIRAFAVKGEPADCVLLALLGLMRETPPELVVSGINGGPNLGGDWLYSGTIGAARVAAFAGIRALAVSGLDDGLPGATAAAVDWVVRLAASEPVRGLAPPEFLSVSLPPVAPDAIRGVRITGRAPLLVVPRLRATAPPTWRVVGLDSTGAPVAGDTDRAAWQDNYIAIVPMRADETDQARLRAWQRAAGGLPKWRSAPPRPSAPR